MESRRIPHRMNLILLLACAPSQLEFYLRVNTGQVQVELAELSIRASGQDWYDEWVQIAIPTELSLDQEWSYLGSLDRNPNTQQRYHHLFLDVERAFWNGEEIKDIVEPTAFPSAITKPQRVNLELDVLKAPSGWGLFLLGIEE